MLGSYFEDFGSIHLLTLGLHPWLAGIMPCSCGFLLYITYSKGKISLSKNLRFWVFEKFQNQRTSSSGFPKKVQKSKNLWFWVFENFQRIKRGYMKE